MRATLSFGDVTALRQQHDDDTIRRDGGFLQHISEMTTELFQQMIADGLPLAGSEMIEFMREQSDNSRRVQMRLNSEYHTPEEIRDLMSEIVGYKVDETFRMFPPFVSIR